MSEYKLYFFEDKKTGKKRNTGIIAKTATEARGKLKRPSSDRARVYKVRKLTVAEQKVASRGGWVRGRADGSRPNDDRKRGYGPRRN